MLKPLNVIRAHIVAEDNRTPYEAPFIDQPKLIIINVKLGKRQRAALGLPADARAYARLTIAKPGDDNVFSVDLKEGA